MNRNGVGMAQGGIPYGHPPYGSSRNPNRTRRSTLRGGSDIRYRLVCGLLAASAGAMAAELEPEAFVPTPGTAALTISGTEAELLRVEFAAPAISLMGFARTPRTRMERETFRLAEENLKTGDGLVRFSTRAACRLASAEVDMGMEGKTEGARQLSASYRFACDRPDLLDSAAVGLFVAFPALERVFVRYDLMGVRGAAELNRRRPVVSFVPLY